MSRLAFDHAVLTGRLLSADVIVVLTGDGTSRLATAIELFRVGGAPRIMVAGGVDDPPYSIHADKLVGVLIDKGVDPERLLVEGDSQHTRESAELVLERAAEEEWGRILLVTSPYHLPRAMLTFIAVLKERGLDEQINVVPVPAAHPNFEVPPGLDCRRIDLVAQEVSKVALYSGDVASYEDGLAYLEHWEANA